jgi:hypothetical protein
MRIFLLVACAATFVFMTLSHSPTTANVGPTGDFPMTPVTLTTSTVGIYVTQYEGF